MPLHAAGTCLSLLWCVAMAAIMPEQEMRMPEQEMRLILQ